MVKNSLKTTKILGIGTCLFLFFTLSTQTSIIAQSVTPSAHCAHNQCIMNAPGSTDCTNDPTICNSCSNLNCSGDSQCPAQNSVCNLCVLGKCAINPNPAPTAYCKHQDFPENLNSGSCVASGDPASTIYYPDPSSFSCTPQCALGDILVARNGDSTWNDPFDYRSTCIWNMAVWFSMPDFTEAHCAIPTQTRTPTQSPLPDLIVSSTNATIYFNTDEQRYHLCYRVTVRNQGTTQAQSSSFIFSWFAGNPDYSIQSISSRILSLAPGASSTISGNFKAEHVLSAYALENLGTEAYADRESEVTENNEGNNEMFTSGPYTTDNWCAPISTPTPTPIFYYSYCESGACKKVTTRPTGTITNCEGKQNGCFCTNISCINGLDCIVQTGANSCNKCINGTCSFISNPIPTSTPKPTKSPTRTPTPTRDVTPTATPFSYCEQGTCKTRASGGSGMTQCAGIRNGCFCVNVTCVTSLDCIVQTGANSCNKCINHRCSF